MVLINDAKPLTLDGQYIAHESIDIIRMIFLDLVNVKHYLARFKKAQKVDKRPLQII
jgi:hypothetical protein